MMNKVIVIGHLGRDPETRYMPNGNAVCSFSVAASERWKDHSGEPKEHTEWFNVTAFGKLAEICGEYLAKGQLVYVEGRQRTEEYEKDGQTRRAVKLIADTMKMLGKKEGDDERPQRPAAPRSAPAPRQPKSSSGTGFDDMDDDIPF